MGTTTTTKTTGATDVLDAADRNLRQAQQRLTTLLAAARLAARSRAGKRAPLVQGAAR
jgi:hypothetical protein